MEIRGRRGIITAERKKETTMKKDPQACAKCHKAIEEFRQALSAAEELEIELSKI